MDPPENELGVRLRLGGTAAGLSIENWWPAESRSYIL